MKKLTTNVDRARYDPEANGLCYFCGISPETTLHLLWECPEVQK